MSKDATNELRGRLLSARAGIRLMLAYVEKGLDVRHVDMDATLRRLCEAQDLLRMDGYVFEMEARDVPEEVSE